MNLAEAQLEWYRRLKEAGFVDIEARAGGPLPIDQSTNSFATRHIVLSFFLRLDQLLTHYPEMPLFERKVMTLYSEGLSQEDIQEKLKVSRKNTQTIIKRYCGLVRALAAIISSETEAQNHLSIEAQELSTPKGTNENGRLQNKKPGA